MDVLLHMPQSLLETSIETINKIRLRKRDIERLRAAVLAQWEREPDPKKTDLIRHLRKSRLWHISPRRSDK